MAKQTKTYQELKNTLDEILAQLQHEDTDIDEAVKLHKQGREILKQLEVYLVDVAKHAELDIKLKKVD